MIYPLLLSHFFFFNDTATTEIYTLSLHDALPIYAAPDLFLHHLAQRLAAAPHRAEEHDHVMDRAAERRTDQDPECSRQKSELRGEDRPDRKSTRLNSSHDQISYAVFCLKKKKPDFRPELFHERGSYNGPGNAHFVVRLVGTGRVLSECQSGAGKCMGLFTNRRRLPPPRPRRARKDRQ